MPRFYVPPETLLQPNFSLPENAARHVQVLRSQPGEIIELFDGKGHVYQAEITQMGKKNVDVHLGNSTAVNLESPLKTTLLQSVSASERMDLTIQKSVELGISTIQPLISERSMQRLAGERADRKTARWQDIAIGACEQSGRTCLPEIKPILPFRAALADCAHHTFKLLMSLDRHQALNHLVRPQSVALLIGPEGGLSPAEENMAIEEFGFHAISLGPRVLRTETAALAALAAMQMLWGDFAR